MVIVLQLHLCVAVVARIDKGQGSSSSMSCVRHDSIGVVLQAMHERLAEITQTSIPRFPTSQQGQGSTTDIDGSESEASKHEGMDNVLTEQDVMMMGSEQPDFDFRLSMLPTWARKAAMSRPSMAQEASKGLQRVHSAESGIRMAEGKWAEVGVILVCQWSLLQAVYCFREWWSQS